MCVSEVWVSAARYAEVVVLVLFVLLALLWLFREPRFIPGWASVFRSDGGARSSLVFTHSLTQSLSLLSHSFQLLQ